MRKQSRSEPVRRPAGPRSEFRDSDVNHLATRVERRGYQHYLLAMHLEKLRGFVGQKITFDFPVTAIIGPNGGGKSTVLGAAALVHRDIEIPKVFPRSGSYDAGMKGWKIGYQLLDGKAKHVTYRTATFSSQRWDRGRAVGRPVVRFGVDRTVPASERKSFARFISGTFAAGRETAPEPDVSREVSRILGRPSAEYVMVYPEGDADLAMLAAHGPKGERYSEFHFGAGEASVARVVNGINAAPDESLVLIEEIENGLHPAATSSLVEYLLFAARKRGIQVIFTTHSNDALEYLPPPAIWVAYDGRLVQGKVDVRTLRTLTGRVSVRLVIYVEDRFGQEMARTALRWWQGGRLDTSAVEICAAEGADTALNLHRWHRLSSTVPYPSVCIVDGDKRDRCADAVDAVAFPGNGHPEGYVFDAVVARLDDLLDDLTRAMQLPGGSAPEIRAAVESTARRNRDRHGVFGQIADEIGGQLLVVEGAFLSLWAEHWPEDIDALLSPLAERLYLLG